LKLTSTESLNHRSRHLDSLPIVDALRLINEEDAQVAAAVKDGLPQIAKLAAAFVATITGNGRVFLVGAGTSGRIGAMEAAECPPTFGVSPETVQAIVAGGREAAFMAAESSEDDDGQGAFDVREAGVGPVDLVIGLTASGSTPYVLGALTRARELGAKTGIVVCNPDRLRIKVDIVVRTIVGPEVLLGSTRMKAGTAQKMVLNMLTTTAMAKLGRVYGNLMVDLRPTNAKLKNRAKVMVCLATGSRPEAAEAALVKADWSPKRAILSLLTGLSVEAARQLLDQSEGNMQRAIDMARGT